MSSDIILNPKRQDLIPFFSSPVRLQGVKVGDEILLLNGTPASALRMDDLRGAFLRPALTLSLSTLPPIDPLLLCPHPPRRPDRDPDPATDIFSRDQGEGLDPPAFPQSC